PERRRTVALEASRLPAGAAIIVGAARVPTARPFPRFLARLPMKGLVALQDHGRRRQDNAVVMRRAAVGEIGGSLLARDRAEQRLERPAVLRAGAHRDRLLDM